MVMVEGIAEEPSARLRRLIAERDDDHFLKSGFLRFLFNHIQCKRKYIESNIQNFELLFTKGSDVLINKLSH